MDSRVVDQALKKYCARVYSATSRVAMLHCAILEPDMAGRGPSG